MLENIPVPYARNIKVTGWGFFEEMSQAIDETKKSAVIFLSPLSENDMMASLETTEIREKILNIAKQLIEKGYSVSIKPHPLESKDYLEKQLQASNMGKVKIIDCLSAGEVISQHEIIVNRGNSQTCLESLHQGKKLLIYPLGIKTIFDSSSNVLSGPNDLDEKLDFLNSDQYPSQMQEIITNHIPYDRETSLQNISNFIETADQLQVRKPNKALHLSLLNFILGEKEKARELTAFLSKAEANTICKFYRRPYIPRRFLKTLSMFEKDYLGSFYVTIIYICYIAKLQKRVNYLMNISLFRRCFVCDQKWIKLPDKDFIPYFWTQTRESFAQIYGQS